MRHLFSVEADVLESALRAASHVIPNNTPKEELKYALISSDGESVKVQATDIERWVEWDLCVSSLSGKFEVLVPVERVLAISREARGEVLSVETDDSGKLRITSYHSEFELVTLDASGFSRANADEYKPLCVIPADALRRVLLTTLPATCKDDIRYAINGVLLQADEQGLHCVATDTRRLVIYDLSLWLVPGWAGSVIIPAGLLRLLLRLMPGEGDEVYVKIASGTVQFSWSGCVVRGQSIVGKFPPYKDAIPKQFKIEFTLRPCNILPAVRQAQIMADNEDSAIDLLIEDGAVVATCASESRGYVRAYGGLLDNAVQFGPAGFNPKYLVEFLKTLDAEEKLSFLANDAESAVMFVVPACGCRYVVMPMFRPE